MGLAVRRRSELVKAVYAGGMASPHDVTWGGWGDGGGLRAEGCGISNKNCGIYRMGHCFHWPRGKNNNLKPNSDPNLRRLKRKHTYIHTPCSTASRKKRLSKDLRRYDVYRTYLGKNHYVIKKKGKKKLNSEKGLPSKTTFTGYVGPR